ncbi:electron transfer flavoprotein subunit alpha/FixB family protein [Desulfamplus magnetovallimortis]|nr:electron transfer flavoprotein subunit alpha/FixB family protein [Desulfamplus magnetovallimortis]
MKKTGIIIEFKNGAVKDASYGMIACARNGGGDSLYAFVINEDAQVHKEALEAHGIHNIVDICLPEIGTCKESGSQAGWNPVIWSQAVMEAMQIHGISELFGLTTPMGRELLPRIAAKLDAPLVMDCIEVNCSEGIVQNYLYSGKTLATIKVKGDIRIYGIRPNVIEPAPAPVSASMFTVTYSNAHKNEPDCGKITLLESRPGDNSDGDLLEADVIISGGRGMQNGENFKLLHQCARYLGAKVGASRVAVDLGWVPYSMQVGQTGEKVSPRVYIACGLSGSVQHFAGMKMSGMIIAINNNPNAAIMANCDYFIEGDLFDVIPALTEALSKAK